MLYVRELLEMLGVENSVDHAIINTGYCNSAANKFLDANDIKHVTVPTGVKNAVPVV